MKKILTMAMLASVLSAVPVFGAGLATAPRNDQARIPQTNTTVPIFMQVRIRIGDHPRRRRRVVAVRRVYPRRVYPRRVYPRRQIIRYRRRHWRRR